MLSLLQISMFTLAVSIKPVTASRTIYIQADGSIDPPTAPISTVDNITYTFVGDIINETIVVKRHSVVVNGEDHILRGAGTGYGFHLFSNNVTVRNTRIVGFDCGILCDVDFGGESRIIGNTISGNGIAIWMNSMDSTVDIINNTIRKNDHVGIYLESWCGCWGGRIVGNLVADNREGIWLQEVTCVLRNNILRNNGLDVAGSYIDHFLQDIDASNTIDGKPICYWRNKENKTVPLNAAYVALVNCKKIIVENLTLTGNGQGIVLAGTTDSTVRNLNIAHNSQGIVLIESSHNRIYANNITNCSRPLVDFFGANNMIYHNNFIHNYYSPWISFSQDLLDGGYPFGGNYWSDYNGTDLYCGAHQNLNGSDGIGETPYIIEELGGETYYMDRYPLMETWTPSWEPIPPLLTGDINYDGKVDIYDIVYMASIYGCKEGDLDWNPFADLAPQWGVINIYDLVTCTYHYGETYP